MELILLSDVHLMTEKPVGRIGDVLTDGLEKLSFVIDYVKEAKDSRFLLQAGDLTHKPRSWILLPLLLRLFRESGLGQVMGAVFGQHDTYLYSEVTRSNTVLGALEAGGFVKVLGGSPFYLEKGNVAIYGCSYKQEIPRIEKGKGVFNVLVVHAPIFEGTLYPGDESSNASEFLRRYSDFDLILCGDIHRKFWGRIKDRWIVNTGSMIRFVAEEYSFKHVPSMGVFNTKTRELQWKEIPHKDATKVLSRDHVELESERKEILSDLIAKIKSDVEVKDVPILEAIHTFLKDNEIQGNVELILSEVIGHVETDF